MAQQKKIAAAYARQSLLKKDSLSIEGQLSLCARAAGDEELAQYKDAGYSGKNTERPDFQRLLHDVKANKIKKLYVYRLDRFSRSVADFGQLWDVLQAHNVEFVSVNENFDTTTPMGRAMLHIIMVFAQLERETTAERVRDNYYRRAALGAWPGGPAPYGYDTGKACTPEGRMISTLIPNAAEAVVRRIYEEYVGEDMSLSKLARTLTAENIPGPRREVWDNVTLSRILHNPAYVAADEQVRLHLMALGANVTSPPEAFDGVHGVLLVGKRKPSDRKFTSYQDHSASVLNSVGFIPADLWLRCQGKLAHNRQLGNSGKGTYTWLSGLLKCARCGYSLKILDREHRWLLCSGRYNLASCDASIHVKLADLEAAAQQELERLLAECPLEPAAPQENVYTKQLAELDRRADRLMDAFAESCELPSSYLQRSLARLEAERQTILEAQRREGSRIILPTAIGFSTLGFEEKKAVAAQFIRRIDVGEDSAEIIWNV